MEWLRSVTRLAALFIAISLASDAWGSVQSTASIKAAVNHYLTEHFPGESYEFEVGHVDRRLRLPLCERPLEGFAPPGRRHLSGRATVGVRCNSARPWKVYVDAKVRHFQDVVVTARALLRGTVVGPADITLERRDVSRLGANFYTDPSQVIGNHLRRSVRAADVVSARWLKRPVDVRRGQRVVLLARTSGLEVRMEGKALANAEIGQIVRVRNARSKRIVEGVVRSAGVVDVPL